MRIFAAMSIAFLLASCASGGRSFSDREQFNRVRGKPVANPSAIVAAELSFARLAQEKGQWTAFRETAADDAVMFTPNKVNAQAWLKGKADPPTAVDWQPHKIFVSCDGSLGVSKGTWQAANGTAGHFTTIWRQEGFGQRDFRKDTEWKWVFDDGVPLEQPLEEPDFIETEVASCKGNVTPVSVTDIGSGSASGQSIDGTLTWQAIANADKSRSVSVKLWDGSNWNKVLTYEASSSE